MPSTTALSPGWLPFLHPGHVAHDAQSPLALIASLAVAIGLGALGILVLGVLQSRRARRSSLQLESWGPYRDRFQVELVIPPEIAPLVAGCDWSVTLADGEAVPLEARMLPTAQAGATLKGTAHAGSRVPVRLSALNSEGTEVVGVTFPG